MSKTLLPDELRTVLPGMGSSPEIPLKELLVHLKFSDPANRWRWYVLEFDGEGIFFGLVINAVAVVAGQFTLAELESLYFDEEKPEGEGVSRDVHFQPMTVAELAGIEPGIKRFLDDQKPLVNIQ